MTFQVTVLGSASALPTSNRYLTAHVLNADERFFLIDCGEGTQFQLRKYKAKFGRLNHIFITHLHGDHVFGLPGFISSLNLLGRKETLHIYANSKLKEFLETFLSNFIDKLAFTIEYHNIVPDGFNLIYEDSKLTVHSFPLKHRVPTCGFLFKEKPKLLNLRSEVIEIYKIPVKSIFGIKTGQDFVADDGTIIPNSLLTFEHTPAKSYAFCSDTIFSDDYVSFVEGVDLLYHEATFCDQDSKRAKQTFHSTASQAAEVAKKANVKKLIIGHFSARYKETDLFLEQARKIFPNTFIAEEGAKFTI